MTYPSSGCISPPKGGNATNLNLKAVLAWFPAVALAIVLSIYFIDDWMAVHVMQILMANNYLHKGTSNIPDVLALAVVTICVYFWGRYFVLRRQGAGTEQLQGCKTVGTTVPIAFILKWPLKFVFGRLNPRNWLESHASNKFHWFHGGAEYVSFPSGHMLVFAALFTTLWLFYPRHRSIFAGFALLLATALITTNYHFVSDVIAGAYSGLLIAAITDFYFKKV
jgi:membrane-associated phospholipid phosphatase